MTVRSWLLPEHEGFALCGSVLRRPFDAPWYSTGASTLRRTYTEANAEIALLGSSAASRSISALKLTASSRLTTGRMLHSSSVDIPLIPCRPSSAAASRLGFLAALGIGPSRGRISSEISLRFLLLAVSEVCEAISSSAFACFRFRLTGCWFWF